MILAIILNSEESAATKGSNDVNGAAPSPLASWRRGSEGGGQVVADASFRSGAPETLSSRRSNLR